MFYHAVQKQYQQQQQKVMGESYWVTIDMFYKVGCILL